MKPKPVSQLFDPAKRFLFGQLFEIKVKYREIYLYLTRFCIEEKERVGSECVGRGTVAVAVAIEVIRVDNNMRG